MYNFASENLLTDNSPQETPSPKILFTGNSPPDNPPHVKLVNKKEIKTNNEEKKIFWNILPIFQNIGRISVFAIYFLLIFYIFECYGLGYHSRVRLMLKNVIWKYENNDKCYRNPLLWKWIEILVENKRKE